MHRGYGIFRFGGILSLILIIVIGYFIIRYLSNNKNSSSTFKNKNSALEILNERYARGEIDEEEYNRRKNILKE